MRILNGDIIYMRDGTPAVVKKVDGQNGTVNLDDKLQNVQKHAEGGVKNGLTEGQRKSFNVNLNLIKGDSKQEEIRNLYDLIQNHKDSKRIDPKVLHYLENELMHRMHRDNYVPEDYATDLRNVPQY
ncbi:MAG: hypothetical protein EBR09_05790 [Proteobacteria bacterium]|nr:hypothetical protein [Pseudomonadota bacterium]